VRDLFQRRAFDAIGDFSSRGHHQAALFRRPLRATARGKKLPSPGLGRSARMSVVPAAALTMEVQTLSPRRATSGRLTGTPMAAAYLGGSAPGRPIARIAGEIFSTHIRLHFRPANRKASRRIGPTEA
jgi:hypothetical protein